MKTIKIDVISVFTLNAQVKKEIERALMGIFGKNTLIKYEEDKNLIGGMVVRSGSKVIDLSIKNLLERI